VCTNGSLFLELRSQGKEGKGRRSLGGKKKGITTSCPRAREPRRERGSLVRCGIPREYRSEEKKEKYLGLGPGAAQLNSAKKESARLHRRRKEVERIPRNDAEGERAASPKKEKSTKRGKGGTNPISLHRSEPGAP